MNALTLLAACCDVCSPCTCGSGCPCPRFAGDPVDWLLIGATGLVLTALLLRSLLKPVARV
jgi:hypothetical protein